MNILQKIVILIIAVSYKNIIKPILFKIDPEKVHTVTTNLGEKIGRQPNLTKGFDLVFYQNTPTLNQNLFHINFNNPIGLAAGFDYEAKLTQILPSLGFGFQTVGTITYSAYEGNSRPMLGRLPKSKSLLVNKGFKNLGAVETIKKLENLNFKIPVGISIGRTNSLELKTQNDSVEDIIKSFTLLENSSVNHSYYELNISCPNLKGNIDFYDPSNLKELLSEIDSLKVSRPIFIKMPINETDQDVIKMMDVISKSSAKALIFGNLQKDRQNESFDMNEIEKAGKGHFSGKPTYVRSNELIKLSYKHFNQRFKIIGCGGIFSPEDAYQKITLGASLVQMITGIIFDGPQIVSKINNGLNKFLDKDGFTNISKAVGSKNKV